MGTQRNYDSWKTDDGCGDDWPEGSDAQPFTCPHGIARRARDQAACESVCVFACRGRAAHVYVLKSRVTK